tara:strand:+ start:244 stop:1017 length:774 start_codon:yes stop_codon:yes gene_type:complete
VNIDFSIIIPTYNSDKYLTETINSIINQDATIKIECIFADGGSTDSTLNIINNLYQKNITKIIIHNQVGLSKALNEAFKKSNGKYLTYLNSDDKLQSNTLIKVKKAFEENSNVNWIIGECENFGKKNLVNKLVNKYKSLLLKKISFNILCINNIISQPSVFWKSSFFNTVGNFDENLKFNMDYDLWLRMIKISAPTIINSKLSYFRRHSNSLSHKNLFSQFKEKYITMKKYNNNFYIKFTHATMSLIILIIYKITNY